MKFTSDIPASPFFVSSSFRLSTIQSKTVMWHHPHGHLGLFISGMERRIAPLSKYRSLSSSTRNHSATKSPFSMARRARSPSNAPPRTHSSYHNSPPLGLSTRPFSHSTAPKASTTIPLPSPPQLPPPPQPTSRPRTGSKQFFDDDRWRSDYLESLMKKAGSLTLKCECTERALVAARKRGDEGRRLVLIL